MRKKILIATLNIIVIMWISILSCSNVSATIGNTETFVYSNDFFSGDYYHLLEMGGYFTNEGKSVNYIARPKLAYGLNSILTNSDCTHISTHGMSAGSKLVLDNDPYVYYMPSNVPTQMNCNLAFISACYGAKTNTSTNTNLCSTLVSRGYKTVIGYKEEVGVQSSRVLEDTFYKNWITYGKPASAALSTARSYASSVYGSNDEAVTSVTLYGNGGLVH